MRIAYFDDKRVDIREYESFLAMCKESEVEPYITCAEGHQVIAKRGEKNAHHFSHKANTICSSHDNKGPWHIWWQDRVQRDSQEVRLEGLSHNKQKILHIADTLIPLERLSHPHNIPPWNGCKGYVIEYQHSPMEEKVMRERESFYTQQGYHLIWIFDTSLWEIHIIRKGTEISFRKRRGADFPMLGAFSGKVTKIFDFNKNQLVVITSQVGSTMTGKVISLEEFDIKYLGSSAAQDIDIRPFHHPLI